MVLSNRTDWINSYESNLDLSGRFDILDIFSNIDSNEGIVRYLDYFNYSLWYIWEVFIPVIELTLFSIDVWMLANQVRSFYPPTLKFYECVCYHEPCPCLMSYSIALMLVWSSLIKMHVTCHIFKLTFNPFWWCLRSCSSTHPNSPLLWFDLVWHAHFLKITLVYLGTLN